MGLVVSLWFGYCLNETCTLNWAPYTSKQYSNALRALSYFIILFPSIDVCSAFPLVVHTTVNNIYIVIFNRDTSQDKGWKYFFLQRGMKLVAAILPISIGMFISNLVSVLNYAGLIGYFISFHFPIILHVWSQWVCHKLFSYDHSSIRSIYENDSKQEKIPLLAGSSKGTSIPLYQELINFFFTYRYSRSYTTPYSTSFSHPIFAIIVALLGVVCFILTIVSFIVPYQLPF